MTLDAPTMNPLVVLEPGTVGVALRPKVERFAQLFASYGNAARAYREAFDVSPTTRRGTIKQRAYELVHQPAVAARVRELLAQAAEGTTISARTRMVRLQDIVEADPSELVHIVAEPCPQCWADAMVMAVAIDNAAAAGADLDLQAPRESCTDCKGHGVRRVVITPTDDLSPAARRLLKSVRQKADGSIEVHLHDQLAALDQLNRMQGVYVDKSVSVTAHVHVDRKSVV